MKRWPWLLTGTLIGVIVACILKPEIGVSFETGSRAVHPKSYADLLLIYGAIIGCGFGLLIEAILSRR